MKGVVANLCIHLLQHVFAVVGHTPSAKKQLIWSLHIMLDHTCAGQKWVAT